MADGAQTSSESGVLMVIPPEIDEAIKNMHHIVRVIVSKSFPTFQSLFPEKTYFEVVAENCITSVVGARTRAR